MVPARARGPKYPKAARNRRRGQIEHAPDRILGSRERGIARVQSTRYCAAHFVGKIFGEAMSLEMVCTCSLSGICSVEDRRLRIFRRMNLANMADLATAIVLSLAFDFGSDAWISADMWFGVSLDTPLDPDGVYIECDHPADGLAAIWEYLAERFTERVSVNGGACDPNAEQRSAELFAQCIATDAPYQEHRATVHEGKDGWCDECTRIHHPYVEAHVAIDNAWGADTLDKAVDAAFGE
jgi:hypothetical protein